jgi:hypothetical protein
MCRGGFCKMYVVVFNDGGDEKYISDISGKARRKETMGKTKALVGGQY